MKINIAKTDFQSALNKSKLLNILRCLSFCSESWKLNEDKTKLKNQKDMK